MRPGSPRGWRAWLEAYRLAVELRVSAKTPVVVFQMGKVGSSSVHDSLKAAGVRPVLHAHALGPDDPHPARRLLFRRLQSGRAARFITLVRDPIARNVSAFFENLDRDHPEIAASGTLDPDSLRSAFLADDRHRVPLEWFDRRLRPVLGIDVYAHPFPHERGALTLRSPPHELLILKTELPDETKARHLAQFLGIRDLELFRANEGLAKGHAQAYAEFKKRLRLPKEYVEELYESRYGRHFFGAAELEHLRRSWTGASDAGA